MIAPRDFVAPLESSEGTSPTNAPIVRPESRCQSPISTARANAVSVETPRRQPNRRTTGVRSQSAAIASIASSSRSRRSRAATTAP